MKQQVSKLSQVVQQSSSSAQVSQSSCEVSFFFGGYSSSKSHQDAVNEAFKAQSNMEIQVGMSVAKVTIGREWFSPGVFLFSSDMYNTSSERIAPSKDYADFTDERFSEMNKCVPLLSGCICHRTGRYNSVFLFDCALQFLCPERGGSFGQRGGFFIFGGSSSSASSSSKSNSCATSTSNSVTVRFTTPQILGYYLEATAADRSVSISGPKSQSDSDFISIFDFIKDFPKMLDDYNATYHKDKLDISGTV